MDLGNVDLIHVLLWPFYFFLAMGDVRGNEPLWFLISLFFVRTLGEIVARLNFSLQAFLLVALVLIGWYLSDIGMMLPIGFQTLFIGLSFYMVASWFQMLKQFEGLRSYRHAVLCIALFIFILACFVAPSYLDVHRNDLWYGDYFAFYLFSLSGIYTFLKLFELCRFRILEWIGKKAIYFLVLHWPVFSIASYAWGLVPHSIGDLGQLFYLIVVAVSVSIICARYISENKMGLS